MKLKFLCLFAFLALSVWTKAQDAKVSGTIVDTISNLPVQKVVVSLGTMKTASDEKGFFEFAKVPYGNHIVLFQADGFETFSVQVEVSKPEVKIENLTIKQKMLEEVDKSEGTISEQDLEVESKEQNVSGPLHSASDVFISTVGFTLGAGGFKIRGYDSENVLVYMNGVPVNNSESGRATWSEWGGLNDVTRNKDANHGILPMDFSFGNVGGATNIDTRASHQRKGTKLSYALSNKTYTNRLMATYNTGLLSNGWAFSVSGSRRWGNGGYVEGTFYDAWAYFMGIEKKINEKHSVGITMFAAPTKRGMQSPATQEAYDLAGSNYYNPNWGYHDGEVRNAKVKRLNEPYILLNHYWDVNKQTKVNTAIGYTFGETGTSSLNWYNAADPRPDYYRYLPSYQTDSTLKVAFTNSWKNDENFRQINWAKLYQSNYLANLEGKQANYIIEERRDDYSQLGISSNIKHEIDDHISLVGGFELKRFKGEHYKTILDLLGGKYWVDIDQFAERDFQADSVKLQNDLNNPNRVIKEGDRYGYDYISNINTQLFWAQANFTYSKIDFFAAASVTGTQYWRTGNMKNGRYPDNSLGDSEKQEFNNYGVKGGATYKITGRHFVTVSSGYFTKAPSFRNIYISPRVRDNVIQGLDDEEIWTGSIGYITRYPKIQAGITFYQTSFWNGSEINSFYHDVYRTYVNQALSNIDKVHKGVEIGAEIKALKSLSVIAVASLGQYYFTSRPDATVSYDNGSKPDTKNIIYQKNFMVPGTPQKAGSIGLKYSHPKYWFANINFNYFGDIYMDFNPERRTSAALDGLDANSPQIDAIVEQIKVDDQYTLDASIGKSIKYKDYLLNINLNVSNILDNQDFITNGFEQMRFDFETKNTDKFDPKYFYSFGRTFFLGVTLKF